MTYFDSCYLAKLYLMEPDSPVVRARAAALADLASCLISWGEIIATLHRHLRDQRLKASEFHLLVRQVEEDIKAGLWTPLPLTTRIAESQAQRISRLPSTVVLRAADALHLTCAAESGLQEIYSSDRHLGVAAPHFGLKVVIL